MRYLKLASAKSPDTDYIELNDFNGFLCTSFQTVGISRKLEFLEIENRQFAVSNKTNFKKYSLIIEILTKYSEYEAKHRQLITFLDRNKKGGLRLYYRPYDGEDMRYCLCEIESSNRPSKMQPVLLTLAQGSLWFGEKQDAIVSQSTQSGNLFEFAKNEDVYDVDDKGNRRYHYSANFMLDEGVAGDYYCIAFFNGSKTTAEITNGSYNEIPLNIRIDGRCTNPVISLFKKGEGVPIRQTKIHAVIDSGHYLEINANIAENGVWYVEESTGKRVAYDERVEAGSSPYFYIDTGDYYITVQDDVGSATEMRVTWQEEFSE